MFVMPLLGGISDKRILAPWSVLVVHVIASKLRYIRIIDWLYGRHTPVARKFALVPLTFVEFALWIAPIFQTI